MTQVVVKVLFLISFFLSMVVWRPVPLRAENYLYDPGVKIARHDKRETRTLLTPQGDAGYRLGWGLLFESEESEAAKDVVKYEVLKNCAKPEVRLDEVFHRTPGTDAIDVLFYDPKDAKQVALANQHTGLTVPYLPLLVRDKATHQVDRWQMFARFIQVNCLPTRFNFTDIGSKRYISYRMGSAAWQTQQKQ